jgi:hypothetical protein
MYIVPQINSPYKVNLLGHFHCCQVPITYFFCSFFRLFAHNCLSAIELIFLVFDIG